MKRGIRAVAGLILLSLSLNLAFPISARANEQDTSDTAPLSGIINDDDNPANKLTKSVWSAIALAFSALYGDSATQAAALAVVAYWRRHNLVRHREVYRRARTIIQTERVWGDWTARQQFAAKLIKQIDKLWKNRTDLKKKFDDTFAEYSQSLVKLDALALDLREIFKVRHTLRESELKRSGKSDGFVNDFRTRANQKEDEIENLLNYWSNRHELSFLSEWARSHSLDPRLNQPIYMLPFETETEKGLKKVSWIEKFELARKEAAAAQKKFASELRELNREFRPNFAESEMFADWRPMDNEPALWIVRAPSERIDTAGDLAVLFNTRYCTALAKLYEKRNEAHDSSTRTGRLTRAFDKSRPRIEKSIDYAVFAALGVTGSHAVYKYGTRLLHTPQEKSLRQKAQDLQLTEFHASFDGQITAELKQSDVPGVKRPVLSERKPTHAIEDFINLIAQTLQENPRTVKGVVYAYNDLHARKIAISDIDRLLADPPPMGLIYEIGGDISQSSETQFGKNFSLPMFKKFIMRQHDDPKNDPETTENIRENNRKFLRVLYYQIFERAILGQQDPNAIQDLGPALESAVEILVRKAMPKLDKLNIKVDENVPDHWAIPDFVVPIKKTATKPTSIPGNANTPDLTPKPSSASHFTPAPPRTPTTQKESDGAVEPPVTTPTVGMVAPPLVTDPAPTIPPNTTVVSSPAAF